MNLTYSKTRTISTADMFAVFLDPPLTMEYISQPTIEATRKMIIWEAGDFQDNDLLVEIAAMVIVAVTNDEGERYEMGSLENITALGEATEMGLDLVSILVRGWITMVNLDRINAKKKLKQFSKVSTTTKNGKIPVEV